MDLIITKPGAGSMKATCTLSSFTVLREKLKRQRQKMKCRIYKGKESIPSNHKNYLAGNPNKTGTNHRVNGYDKPSYGRKILRASKKDYGDLILAILEPIHKSLNRNLERTRC